MVLFLFWQIFNIPFNKSVNFFNSRPDVVFVKPEMIDRKDGDDVFYLLSDRAEFYKNKGLLNLEVVTINSIIVSDNVIVKSSSGKYYLKDGLLELADNEFSIVGDIEITGESDSFYFNKGDDKLYLTGNIIFNDENRIIKAKEMLYDLKTKDMYIEKRATINFSY